METLEDLDRKTEEYLLYKGEILPSGFLEKVGSVKDLENVDKFDVMVRVVAAEAERQGNEGKEAVANVIKNRRDNPRRWGDDIKSVLLEDPDQFEALKRLKHKVLNPRGKFSKKELEEAIEAAGAVYFGHKKDNTGGADHFHHKKVMPWWGHYMCETVTIGEHTFRNSRFAPEECDPGDL